jgi:hypothetical protein
MFATDLGHDPEVLNRYVCLYPHAARDLAALLHELELQKALAGDNPIDARSEVWIDGLSIDIASAPNPFANLDVARYASVRDALGVPTIILNAFRDRLVAAGTVPLRFLEQLAQELGTGLSELIAFLAQPPGLQKAVQHKSDKAPRAPMTKVSFASLLDDAGVSAEQALELLAED